MVEYHKFVDADNTAKAIDNVEGDITYAEWKRLVSNSIDTGDLTTKEKIELFGMPIEAFCTDPQSVDVVDTVAVKGVPDDDLRASVEYVVEQSDIDPFNKAIGIHVTTMDSANKILDEGIKPFNEEVRGKHTIRDGSVFFWIHSTDVGEMMYDHPDGVVVTAPVDKVKVSSFLNYDLLTGGYTDVSDYDGHHVVDYMDYVEELTSGVKASPAHGSDTLF